MWKVTNKFFFLILPGNLNFNNAVLSTSVSDNSRSIVIKNCLNFLNGSSLLINVTDFFNSQTFYESTHKNFSLVLAEYACISGEDSVVPTITGMFLEKHKKLNHDLILAYFSGTPACYTSKAIFNGKQLSVVIAPSPGCNDNSLPFWVVPLCSVVGAIIVIIGIIFLFLKFKKESEFLDKLLSGFGSTKSTPEF